MGSVSVQSARCSRKPLARSGQKEVSMGKLSFWESVRVWLGGVAFDVFLWSVRMSADDYFDMIQTEGGLTKRAADKCARCGSRVDVGNFTICDACHADIF